MATRLRKYLPARRHGPSPKYPWDKWLDGSIWRLSPGADFSASTSSMADMLRQRAKARGIAVNVYREEDGCIVVRAVFESRPKAPRKPRQ